MKFNMYLENIFIFYLNNDINLTNQIKIVKYHKSPISFNTPRINSS